MTAALELTDALNGKWYRSYGMALCPAHDNRHTPALSIGTGNDGKLLIKCFAGCSFFEIKDALERLGFWRHESDAAVSRLYQKNCNYIWSSFDTLLFFHEIMLRLKQINFLRQFILAKTLSRFQ